MNAVSHATTLGLTSKIAHLAILFRAEFPNATADLSPWLSDEQTQRLLNPNSIDLCFHFPQPHIQMNCSSVLILTHFSQELTLSSCELNMVEASGFNGTVQQWQFSTADGEFAGNSPPQKELQERFRKMVSHIFELFQRPNYLKITTEQ
ncbi:MAG: hypothetical protein AAGA75_03050 [Cyanobacteria bacterium P01_E01_bin.6]